jgi:hypothetical protein
MSALQTKRYRMASLCSSDSCVTLSTDDWKIVLGWQWAICVSRCLVTVLMPSIRDPKIGGGFKDAAF